MHKMKGLIILALVLFAASASSEFYKYRDQNGNIVFTDDPTQVPRDQLPAAQKFQNYQAPVQESRPESPSEAETTPPAAGDREQVQKTTAAVDERIRDLDVVKKELELEYQALLNEKKELDGQL